MSLKDFHIVFIISSIVLLFGFGFWAIQQYQQNQIFCYVWTAVISFIAALGLIVYELKFLKKMRSLE